MKVQIDFDYDAALARAVAIKNGGRGLAQPEEIRSWARETLSVSADIAVQEMRESMEGESSSEDEVS
jgi:hypothetical protein